MLSICSNSRIKSWRNRKNTERTFKHFTNKNNWEEINFPSQKEDWKKIEKNNVTIALNVLYAKQEKIYPNCVSKHNKNCEKIYSFNDFK